MASKREAQEERDRIECIKLGVAEGSCITPTEWEEMTVAEEEELLEDACAQYVLQHVLQAVAEELTSKARGAALIELAAYQGNEEAQKCSGEGMYRYMMSKIQDEVEKGILIEGRQAILRMLMKRAPEVARCNAARAKIMAQGNAAHARSKSQREGRGR